MNELKKEEPKKRYVQMIQWECLICHRSVGLTEDGTKIVCECMVYPADKFSTAFSRINPVVEFDNFFRTTEELEEYWSVLALWVKKDPQIPDRFDHNHRMHEFMKPHQIAHTEWLLAHPLELCACPDCRGNCSEEDKMVNAALLNSCDEPVREVKPVVKPSKRKYQQVELAL
jgi:hypothetical protein